MSPAAVGWKPVTARALREEAIRKLIAAWYDEATFGIQSSMWGREARQQQEWVNKRLDQWCEILEVEASDCGITIEVP